MDSPRASRKISLLVSPCLFDQGVAALNSRFSRSRQAPRSSTPGSAGIRSAPTFIATAYGGESGARIVDPPRRPRPLRRATSTVSRPSIAWKAVAAGKAFRRSRRCGASPSRVPRSIGPRQRAGMPPTPPPGCSRGSLPPSVPAPSRSRPLHPRVLDSLSAAPSPPPHTTEPFDANTATHDYRPWPRLHPQRRPADRPQNAPKHLSRPPRPRDRAGRPIETAAAEKDPTKKPQRMKRPRRLQRLKRPATNVATCAPPPRPRPSALRPRHPSISPSGTAISVSAAHLRRVVGRPAPMNAAAPAHAPAVRHVTRRSGIPRAAPASPA